MYALVFPAGGWIDHGDSGDGDSGDDDGHDGDDDAGVSVSFHISGDDDTGELFASYHICVDGEAAAKIAVHKGVGFKIAKKIAHLSTKFARASITKESVQACSTTEEVWRSSWAPD